MQGQQIVVVEVGLVNVLEMLGDGLGVPLAPVVRGGDALRVVPPCSLQRVLPLTGNEVQYRTLSYFSLDLRSFAPHLPFTGL